MQVQISFKFQQPDNLININDKILLVGSCFTEHIGKRFREYNWQMLENPTGIVFNPNSIAKTIDRILNNKLISEKELIFHNELWAHWDFHSRYSHTNRDIAIQEMNNSIIRGHTFIKNTDWIFLTLGTAYQYFYLNDIYGVSNCHKLPANFFEKKLLSTQEIISSLSNAIKSIHKINKNAKIILTISPVRHIKDGVVENNRSKARLIEAVHCLVDDDLSYYFPSYELLIDVLRDYRYYDVDLVHPNYAATQTIWEYFTDIYLNTEAKQFLKDMKILRDGYNHRTRFPTTNAHLSFLKNYLNKIKLYSESYPEKDWSHYIEYFKTEINNHPLSMDISRNE